jgi:hypothetical protein
VDPYLRSTPFIQVKQQNELGRAFNGHLADHHQFLFAHRLGRIENVDADIARHRRQIEARLATMTAIGDTAQATFEAAWNECVRIPSWSIWPQRIPCH